MSFIDPVVKTAAQPPAAAPSFPDLTSTPASPDAARAALDSLRNERLANRLSQDQYLSRSEYLQRVIAGEKIAAVDPHAITQEQRFTQQYDELMQPPGPGVRYNFGSPPPGDTTPKEDLDAINVKAAEALRAAGIPAHLGGPIYDSIDAMARKFADASESDIQLQLSSTKGRLQSLWGDQSTARIDAISNFLVEKANASAFLGEILDHTPWAIFGDPVVMEYLDRVVQHRARRR
jgi:hypothetical protein